MNRAPHYAKRHYIEIAKLLKEKGSLNVEDFVELFSADNSRFDEGRFRYASEVSEAEKYDVRRK